MRLKHMKKIIIAIDGYSACGKSTTAKLVANRLQYSYIDTGAMYRAVTLFFCQNYVSFTDPHAVKQALSQIHIDFIFNAKTSLNETYLNGLNVEEEIRKMYISEKVSEVSAVPAVRKAMVEQQQKMGKKRGLVMDGRDIGTRVFPDAELKIFMTADLLVRARRRQEELMEKEELVALEDIIKNLQMRDQIDTTRSESPLKMAEDAYLLDTTHMAVEEQIDFVINLANQKTLENHIQVSHNQ
jgi:CMP/dCMP kinase